MLQTEVLIVGAGPVGLTAATLLRRLGVSCVVVERRGGLHQAPQAHVVSSRTMEIFRALGVPEVSLQQASTPVEDIQRVSWVQSLAGPRLGGVAAMTASQAGFLLQNSPSPGANISQHLLEPILLSAATDAGAQVRFDSKWKELKQDGEGVTSTIQAGGDSLEIRSEYLLACDGAGSRTRKALGIEFIGPELQRAVNVFFRANLRELVKDIPSILYWCIDPVFNGVFIAHHIDSTWVYAITGPEVQDGSTPDEETCRQQIQGAIGADTDFEILSIDPWVMTAQVAERYRDRRVFLLGDAAHRFPPTGGLGMNTGVADVANLGWKLAAVRGQSAGDGLLDSFTEERQPIAQTNSSTSANNAMKMIEVFQALELPMGASEEEIRASVSAIPGDAIRSARVQAAIDNQQEHFDSTGLDFGQCYESGAVVSDGTAPPAVANPISDYVPNTRPGARLPHAWLENDGQRVSTQDLVGLGEFVLLTGKADSGWEHPDVRVLSIAPDGDAQDVEGRWAEIRGIGSDGAILVRPDQHVAYRCAELPADPRAAIDEVLAKILYRARGRD